MIPLLDKLPHYCLRFRAKAIPHICIVYFIIIINNNNNNDDDEDPWMKGTRKIPTAWSRLYGLTVITKSPFICCWNAATSRSEPKASHRPFSWFRTWWYQVAEIMTNFLRLQKKKNWEPLFSWAESGKWCFIPPSFNVPHQWNRGAAACFPGKRAEELLNVSSFCRAWSHS